VGTDRLRFTNFQAVYPRGISDENVRRHGSFFRSENNSVAVNCISLRFVKDEVSSEKGMVTASTPEAAGAGLRILKLGGNAFDAAVAIGFCNTVLEPYLACLGGLGFMVAYSAEEDRVVSLDFNTRAPKGATPDMFKVVGESAAGGTRVFEVEGRENSVGGKAVTVPATCAGFIKAHETYGSLPLKEVVAPAAKLAREGFSLGWDQTLVLGVLNREAMRCPTIDDVWSPGGFPAVPGTKVLQPDLAKLLGRIGEQGRSAVYEGEVARRVEKAVTSAGGVLDAEDLAAYEPTLSEPISVKYQGYEVSTTNTPSGGVTILEALKVLERFDLSSMGHNSGEYLHVLVEASRHAFADRYSLLGDWEQADVPLKGLLSDTHADTLSCLVDPHRTYFDNNGVEPWVRYLGAPIHSPQEPGETTHLNVVDGEGNAVACTHTPGFQVGLVPPRTGLHLSAAMGWFVPKPGYPNSVAPWKRPLMNMGPLIVTVDGAPVLLVGAPGSRRIIDRNLQVALNVLEFGMGPQDAVAAPTVDASGAETLVDSRVPEGSVKRLASLGHTVKVVEEGPGMSFFARPSAIKINRETGMLKGGVDLFRRSTALGL
jgi:gamma-glutamyltranspeptidase/glutathione hydrolase